MTRWEYLWIIGDSVGDVYRVREANGSELKDWKRGPALIDYMNARGAEGWELVGVYRALFFYFKRPQA
jgi:hypothetical protein